MNHETNHPPSDSQTMSCLSKWLTKRNIKFPSMNYFQKKNISHITNNITADETASTRLVWLWGFMIVSFLIPPIFIDNIKIPREGLFYENKEGQMIVISSIVLTIPLILDVILDYAAYKYLDRSLIRLRFISLIAFLCLSFLSIFDTRSLYALRSAFSDAQVMVEFTGIFWLLHRLDSQHYWSTSKCLILSIFIYGFAALSYAGQILDLPSIWTGVFVLIIINVTAILYCSMRYVYFCILLYNKKKRLCMNDQYCFIAIAFISFVLVTYLLIYLLTGGQRTKSIAFQTCTYITRALFNFFICYLPGRLVRRTAIQQEYDAEVKSDLVRYLSHELRTPLCVLSVGLELLSGQVAENAPTAQMNGTVSELVDACTSSTLLLDNLLFYEKLQRNKLTLAPERINILEFLCGSVSNIITIVKRSGARLRMLEGSPSDAAKMLTLNISVDTKLLGAQLLKLMRRAVEGAGAGDTLALNAHFISRDSYPKYRFLTLASRRIYAISNETITSWLRIEIAFHKPITDAEVEYITNDEMKFNRETNSGDGGQELNYFILRRVVQLHGGCFGVFAGRRDAVFIDIPIEVSQYPADAGEASVEERNDVLEEFRWKLQQSSEDSSEPDTRILNTAEVTRLLSRRAIHSTSPRRSVLVVDDSATVRKMISKLMSKLGYDIVEAENGSDALALIVQSMAAGHTFDAVLLDNEMPVMRGRDSVQEMRNLGYKGIVLGITGNAMEDDVVDFLHAGTNEVILKPLTEKKFAEAMLAHR